MTESTPPRNPDPEPLQATRTIGHELKNVLALAENCVERLHRLLLGDQLAGRELVQLRRALAQADYLTGALLGGHRRQTIERCTIDVNEFLTRQEPSLHRVLAHHVTLRLRLHATGGAVLASVDELKSILHELVDHASRAIPAGGELTISTGWIDLVPNSATHDSGRPRRYVRLSVGDTSEGASHEIRRRVGEQISPAGGPESATEEDIASLVGRLGGCLILENEDGRGSRVHVCLRSVPGRGSPLPAA